MQPSSQNAAFLRFVVLILTPSFLGCTASLQRITINPNQSGFITAESKAPFRPWGFNYDRDYRMRLLEDYWQTDWPTVVADFAEMKRLGANVVRVHLQFGKFMDSPDRPKAASLAQLKRLLDLAQSTGLYLDITGLACYRRADVPDWYTDLDEHQRWQAQANFWQAIAATCADHSAVFCYDLINEPAVPAEPRKAKDWLTGDLGGFTYCQFIALDPAGRDRTQIASQWSAMMTAAIRKSDRQTLITVGLLPFPTGTGFDAAAQAKVLDFIAVHYYPDKSDLDTQVKFLQRFAVGKPLVVEEIFPMKSDPQAIADFMQESKFVAGWVSFYWGQSIEDLKKSGTIKDALIIEWLKLFQKNAARMTIDATADSP